MKRVGYLYENVFDMDNLRLAYWKAKRGKGCKPNVVAFESTLDTNLLLLHNQLKLGSISVGNYHYFKVFDPKERQICAATFSERVLHHALINVCHPYFERFQTFDSYASRLGRGTYRALDRAKGFSEKYKWFLKLDVRKYFDSICHQTLKKQLIRLFKDPLLLQLLYRIIDTYEIQKERGVPIGNLTSQYFANHYLAIADHYVKEQLKIPAYVRYMDDMVLWHHDKSLLLEIGKKFESFIHLNLQLKLKPPCLNQTKKGLPFLGYILYPNRISLSQRSRSRFYQKLKLYERNYQQQDWSERDYQNCLIPLLAFTERADAVAFRRQVLRAVSDRY